MFGISLGVDASAGTICFIGFAAATLTLTGFTDFTSSAFVSTSATVFGICIGLDALLTTLGALVTNTATFGACSARGAFVVAFSAVVIAILQTNAFVTTDRLARGTDAGANIAVLRRVALVVAFSAVVVAVVGIYAAITTFGLSTLALTCTVVASEVGATCIVAFSAVVAVGTSIDAGTVTIGLSIGTGSAFFALACFARFTIAAFVITCTTMVIAIVCFDAGTTTIGFTIGTIGTFFALAVVALIAIAALIVTLAAVGFVALQVIAFRAATILSFFAFGKAKLTSHALFGLLAFSVAIVWWRRSRATYH